MFTARIAWRCLLLPGRSIAMRLASSFCDDYLGCLGDLLQGYRLAGTCLDLCLGTWGRIYLLMCRQWEVLQWPRWWVDEYTCPALAH